MGRERLKIPFRLLEINPQPIKRDKVVGEVNEFEKLGCIGVGDFLQSYGRVPAQKFEIGDNKPAVLPVRINQMNKVSRFPE